MVIRDAWEEDYPALLKVVKSAYAKQKFSNKKERGIIKRLLKAEALPISLVAVDDDGQIRGYIAFSPVRISDNSTNWYGMGPVAVHPKFQKQGIGKALITEGLTRLHNMGAHGCVVLGDATYYKKIGFRHEPAMTYPDVPAEHFLALRLKGSVIPIGTVKYHMAFYE